MNQLQLTYVHSSILMLTSLVLLSPSFQAQARGAWYPMAASGWFFRRGGFSTGRKAVIIRVGGCTTDPLGNKKIGTFSPLVKIIKDKTRYLIVFLTISASLLIVIHQWNVQARQHEVDIRLDYRPFTNSKSLYVVLKDNGRLDIVKYFPYQRAVDGFYQGILPARNVSDLLGKTRKPSFQKALEKKEFGGIGLSRGNQFHLFLEYNNGETKECFGFVQDAPEIVRFLIKGLLKKAQELNQGFLADAYLRSETIEKGRLQRLQSTAKMSFMTLQEFPPNLRTILTIGIDSPLTFNALNGIQYDQLLQWSLDNQEIFVLSNGKGYQLTLFSGSVTGSKDRK